jgi:Fe-S cluster assembly ATP-binding protein
MLSIKNLSVSIDKKQILKNISFDFKSGKIYALMGPNGSGKSTLALSIMGHPKINYLRASKILIKKRDIKNLSADKRAKLGIFLSFQTPLALSGVNVFDLLRLAMEKQMDPLTLHKKIQAFADELHIKDELLKRSLNNGFSGGEKKKLEALQTAMLAPKFALFDEIDTGVDVDSIKTISRFLKKHLPKKTTLVFITHSTRLLRYIQPDEVLILKNGKLAATGGPSLAKKIESKGFNEYE